MVLVNLLSVLLDPWDGDELSRAAAAGGKLPQGSGDFSDSLSAHFDWQRWKKIVSSGKLNCHVKLLKTKLFFPPVPPSPELVERVRDLYHKRVPDVRFLIPVINGLEKVPTGSTAIPPSQNVTFYHFFTWITLYCSRTRSPRLSPSWSSSTPSWSKRCSTACWALSTVSHLIECTASVAKTATEK